MNGGSIPLSRFKTQMNTTIKETKEMLHKLLDNAGVIMLYLDNNEEMFSVDIVPAYAFSKNEFGDDVYKVPEVIKKKQGFHLSDDK